MNIYWEISTEKALKFLLKRKYNKVILITSIGKDLSGKRFIEIARKILGFDVIILFFSNNPQHYEWIQKFKNCLYTNLFDLCEEYITNYNDEGLNNLKIKIEKRYKIQLKEFSFDYISYPNCKNEGNYSSLDFKSDYIRHVYIKNGDNYLSMTKDGKVIISKDMCTWDITCFENEITMFSNGFYLDINKDEINEDNEDNEDIVIGYKYMVNWNFKKVNEYYYFINPDKNKKNYILSIKEEKVIVNKKKPGKNELFLLVDVLEEEEE